MIREIIVVEGRDDISAVKRAVDADLIATSGFGITSETMERIKTAAKLRGVIIFTDPDFAGEKIRERLNKAIPGCKHAFLKRSLATKDGDIGIENADPESIIDALSKVKTEVTEDICEFTMEDLFKNNLSGNAKARDLRDTVGGILGIGYGNSKQFLRRLNRYGIKREEFDRAVSIAKEMLK